MIDIETRLRAGLDRSVNRTIETVVTPPVRAIHDGADRRRHRRVVLVRLAGVFVVLVTATGVWWSRHDNDRTISTNTSVPAVTPSTSAPAATPVTSAPAATPVTSVPAVTPLTSRLFPADTNGTRPTDLFPGTFPIPPSKRVDTQLWTRDGQIVFAVRSDFVGGIVVPSGGSEHLNLPTWPDAELATETNGTLSLYLHNLATNATSHVISRTLSRQDLLTIAASITPATDGPGIDIAPGAAPAGSTQTTHDTADIASSVQFELSAIGTQSIFFRLDAQTAAGRLFQQFFTQATPTNVGTEPADLISTAQTTTITWMPIPTVQATISVGAPAAIALPIARRVAASVHQVDTTTWNTLLTPPTADTTGAATTVVAVAPATTIAMAPATTAPTVASGSDLKSAQVKCDYTAAQVGPVTSPLSGSAQQSGWLNVTSDAGTSRVFAVQEIDPSLRPQSALGSSASTVDGHAVVVSVSHSQGADEVLQSTDAGVSWNDLGPLQNVTSVAVAPSGRTVAAATGAAGFTAMAIYSNGTWSTVKSPSVPSPVVEDVAFWGEDRIVAVVQQAVPGYANDTVSLANVWSYSIATGEWAPITTFQTNGDPFYVARTPVVGADGNLYFLVLSSDNTHPGLWLWKAESGDLSQPRPLRAINDTETALVAVNNDNSILWASSDANGTWQLIQQNGGRYSWLACARAGNLRMNNGDPHQAAATNATAANNSSADPGTGTVPTTRTASTVATTRVPVISEWDVDGRLRVVFAAPTSFVLDPKVKPLADVDRADGLYLLKRWIVDGSPYIAALSVQRDPGDGAPINSESKPYATIVSAGMTWNLVDFGQSTFVGADVVALGRLDGYLLEITGTDQLVRSVVAALTISAIG